MDFSTNSARLGRLMGIVVNPRGNSGTSGFEGSCQSGMEPHPPNTRLIRWKPRRHSGLHREPNRPRRSLREDLTKELTRNEVIILRD